MYRPCLFRGRGLFLMTMMGKSKSETYSGRAAAIAAAASRGEGAVGRIKKPYGSGHGAEQGALLVTLFDTFPDAPVGGEPLWVVIDSLAVPLFIASFERRGMASAVVLFDDFERADVAELLVGKTLYTDMALESEDEDVSDFEALVGYELTDRVSGRKGVVRAFYDYPGNPLLGVDFDGREVLVPAADGVIEVVSVRRKRLEGDLPEGLFDL